MNVVTVSSRYQIIIPKKVRESLGIEPGQKVHVFQKGDHVEVVPLRPMSEARESLPGSSNARFMT
ncbi:MAG TPA: AbrB/MazE/SpoVT family DNA-binding domain-containing protein [Gemmatimonadota bacterium]|nr:AbrB/MazE/SpoVT family DNA-binding domain-containing protein [Gemmatimonadota bacterium]